MAKKVQQAVKSPHSTWSEPHNLVLKVHPLMVLFHIGSFESQGAPRGPFYVGLCLRTWEVAHERVKYEKIFLSSLLGHRPSLDGFSSSPWLSQHSPQVPSLDLFSWPVISLVALNTKSALMSLTFISTAWTTPLNLTHISNCPLLICTWMCSGHLKFDMSRRELIFSHGPAPVTVFLFF